LEDLCICYAFTSPSVAHLPIHLPGQQSITFHPNEDPQQLLYRASQADSALTAFFAANQIQGAIGDLARQYTYQEFPEHFTFKSNVSPKRWQPRQHQFQLGRMVTVPHTGGERFYLRTLLTVVRGPTSFEDLLRVPGHPQPCQTFHDACILRGLLEDDGEWIICFQ
jgi:hypothetical protein